MDGKLLKAFEFYLKHQDELVEKYDGRFVVIVNDEVVGAYETEVEAVQESAKRFELGTFLVQRVSSGDTAYSQTFHSRVAFA